MKDFKTLIQDVKADKTLEERIKNEFDAIVNSGEKLSDADVLIKALKSFGYEITRSDLEKLEAQDQFLDLDELEAVSGGEENEIWCVSIEMCYMVFLHKGKRKGDPCFTDYSCLLEVNDL